MDIEKFKSQAIGAGTGNLNGNLRPNRFRVRIFPPTTLSLPNISSDLEFWGEASETPLMQIATHQMQRHGYGSMQKRPNMAAYQDWQVVFRQDQGGNIWRFFKTWMGSIVSNDINTAGNNLYEIAYRDSYLADMQLTIFDSFDDSVIGVTMIEAFPMAISPSRLDWADNNSYLRLSVVFGFTDWIETPTTG